MSRVSENYIRELTEVYNEYLNQEQAEQEKLYNSILSDLYDRATDLIPEEVSYGLRDEGKQRMRALRYLKGQCDIFDQMGDIYPSEIISTVIEAGDEELEIDYNIVGAISSDNSFYNVSELQKLNWQINIGGGGVLIKSPYHKFKVEPNTRLLYAECWRYQVIEEKYHEFFRYILYQHICKDLGVDADMEYIKKLERMKNEIKTSYMVKIEGYRNNKIVSLNYFTKRRG